MSLIMAILLACSAEKNSPFLLEERWLEDPGVGEKRKGALRFFARGRVAGLPLEPSGPDGGTEGGIHC